MRLLSLVLCAAAVFAQPAPTGPLRIDLIEFYGLRRVTVNLARQALGLNEGDALPASKVDTEDRLLDIDRVVSTSLEAVCCEEGKTVLYVGIEEFAGPHYAVRPAPGGAVLLPPELLNAGTDAVPYSQPGRANFVPLVDANLPSLREVLRESGEEFHRAAAAYLLPYASRRAEIVPDLQEALTDNNAEVRARAIRGLLALAQLGRSDPATKIQVQAEWFVPLITSVAWTDRKEAVAALGALTQNGDRAVLKQLRGDTLGALIEMARWRTREHAFPSFLLIGRVAGLRDFEIRDAWDRAGRETVIGQALEKAK
jgi:hypothetical protein